MFTSRSRRTLTRFFGLAALGAALTSVLPTQAAPAQAPFASPRFEQVWSLTDKAVAEGRATRSWTWGPQPGFSTNEPYQQSPGGQRLVQYFDKARMEINDPANTSGPLNGVTNGLLVVEMVSNRIKKGDGIGDDQNEQAPNVLELPVVGDWAGSIIGQPDYYSFENVATIDNGYRDPKKPTGERIGTTFRYVRQGLEDLNSETNGYREELAKLPGTDIVAYDDVTGHNIPRVFNDFINSGPVPAIVSFGHPITDAYWVRARVGGQERDILLQLFERRTITYTPANPDPWKVEMGNVGQHYVYWRYPTLGMAWLGTPLESPITYASKRNGEEFEVYQGENYPITESDRETVPFSNLRTWNVNELRFFGDSTRYNGKRQLVLIDPHLNPLRRDRVSQLRLSNANDYNAAISPDGTKPVFASDRDGNADLYMINIFGPVEPARLTDTTGCTNQYPSWLPDGSGIVYESNCQDGNFEIYRAAFSYRQDKQNELALNQPVSPAQATRLTNNTTDDRYPRVSPDGTLVIFTATRDGNPEIYVMGSDGSRQQAVAEASNPAADEASTWSLDGRSLAFSSNRDGDWEIFQVEIGGQAPAKQLTINTHTDQWPIWAQ